MTLRYPTRAVRSLAGACALLLPSALLAADPAVPSTAPGSAAKALDELEAQAPKEWNDPVAIAASHARVVALIDSNVLQSGADFNRAAALLAFHLGEYRVLRMHYELQLAAAAKGDESAAKALANTWDQLMRQIGRPDRFDFSGWAQKNPEYADYEASPACIQAVWRDPAAARAGLTGVADNPEIKTIVDADQADRQGNWATRTAEEREATMSRDKARNVRMREIIAAGDVRTVADFARAGLVMQHSARFPGHRLAHELAVAAMLLGDKSGGRWLVTASYDRLLRGIGLDQRFATQYGPTGLAPVDEAGICDNQRTALGCPTLAQARARQAQGSRVVDKLTPEIVKPGNVIDDAKFGVKAIYPTGWAEAQVVSADENTRSIRFQLSDKNPVSFQFYYRLLPSPNPSGADAVTLLRKQAVDKETDRRNRQPDYINRPDSFVSWQAHEQPALAWIADYEKDGGKWSEYLVRILGRNSVGLLFITAPSDQIEALKPILDSMADTVQLP